MLVANLFVFIPTCYVLLAEGNHGLWLSFMLFMVTRAVLMAYASNRQMYGNKNNNVPLFTYEQS
jgi:Na+-driven multidrug efflux pump